MWKKVILVLFLFIGLKTTIKTEPKRLSCIEEPPINLSHINLYKTIQSMGIQYPDIVFAQAVLESGNFTSNLAKVNNNLFGMKLAKSRETTAIGRGKSGYAKYESWVHSVQDYFHWQNYFMKDKDLNRKQYLNLLGRVYAEDKHYISRINRKIQEYHHIMN